MSEKVLNEARTAELWEETKRKLSAKQDALTPDESIILEGGEIKVALPVKAVTEEEYEGLSEAERAADVAYLVTDDDPDDPEEHWNHEDLLDNGYFAAPINQLGQEEYAGAGHTIDRWKIEDQNGKMKCSLVDGGIKLELPADASIQAFWTQFFETLPSETLTASVLIQGLSGDVRLYLGTELGGIAPADGVYSVSGSLNDSSPLFRIVLQPGSSCVLRAAKLELGPVQTLAHQDADGNWVLNDPPPNKALELVKCQRHMLVVPGEPAGYTLIGHGKATGSGQLDLQIPLPTSMRAIPSVKMTGKWVAVGSGSAHEFTAEDRDIAVSSIGASEAGIVIFGFTNLNSNSTYTIQRNNDAVAQIILDANL